MPTDIDLELYDEFMEYWPEAKKNEVFEETERKSFYLTFYCQVGTLLVSYGVIIGPRGGLHERVIVIDPNRPIVVERVLLNEYYRLALDPYGPPVDRPYLLPTVEMWKPIRVEGLDPRRVCRAQVEVILARLLADPAQWEKDLRSMTRREVPPPRLVRGGLPGLGKRR